MATKQCFGTSRYVAWVNSATRYTSILGGYLSATINEQAIPMSAAGTLGNCRVVLDTAPGDGKSWVITLMKNGVATGVEVTITGAAVTSGTDADTVEVAAGDLFEWRIVPSGTPAACRGGISCLFTGTTANESNIIGSNLTNTGSTTYGGFGSSHSYTAITSQGYAALPIAAPGTLSHLYVKLSADPGGAPDAYTFTVYKNNVITDITCTIVANDTTGNDTTHSVAVVAGDYIEVYMIPVSTPSVSPSAKMSLKFTASVDGESLMGFANYDAPTNSQTEYLPIMQPYPATTWGTTETNQYTLLQACAISKMYVIASAAPGAGNTITFSVRKNGASPGGTLSVELGEAETTDSDTSNSVTVADDDQLNLMSVPVSSPTVGTYRFGFKQYIAPAGGWTGITEVKGITATNYEEVRGIAVASIAERRGIAV